MAHLQSKGECEANLSLVSCAEGGEGQPKKKQLRAGHSGGE